MKTLARRLSALVGLLLIVITVTPVTGWYAHWLAGSFSDPGGEVLVVLGGSSLEPAIIGDDTYWRAVYAVRAYRERHYARIILSGAGASLNMRDFLVSMGVPENGIQLEQNSHSTRENALAVREMLRGVTGPVALMTSDYHTLRASRAFARAGIKIAPYPIPHAFKLAAHWQTRWPAFLYEWAESVKIVYYAARGWI